MLRRFSIITATFNASAMLDRTIASLRSQTYKGFQWIVVDAASTDDTIQRVRAASDIVDLLISEPDEGIADAWNKGLARVQGDHVLFLNAGDTYDRTFLETIDRHCDGERIICSHARRVSEDGADFGIFRAEPAKLIRAMHVPHNWCAVPRRHYQSLGGYSNIPLAMDFEWFHRYYKQYGAEGFCVIDRAFGDYHLGGTSDVNYAASFKINEQILLANGGNILAARFFRLAYTLKHAVKCRLLQ